MFPTALVYSSHNRCAYIHKDWIVNRALRNPDNKTIIYLPMSMGEMHQQEYGWGTFRWYFDQFENQGLHAHPFYWRDELQKQDVDTLFHQLATYEVVILGGGNSELGMERYNALGERYYGDYGLFRRIMEERQRQGKLTAGFSAGADQLCQYLASNAYRNLADPYGYGLVRDVMCTLHHETGREEDIVSMAIKFPHCMAFGLPNDAGLAVDQGYLDSGNFWQVIEFVIDCSWDMPEDGWHIKTRQGLDIQHYYNDGRSWMFHGGDRMVRIISKDGNYRGAWMQTGGQFLDYWSQQPCEFHNIDHVLSSH